MNYVIFSLLLSAQHEHNTLVGLVYKLSGTASKEGCWACWVKCPHNALSLYESVWNRAQRVAE